MQACKPDWELVQSLYLKGLGPKQIEAQTGVKAINVSVRANRYGWRKHLAQSSVIVKAHNDRVLANAEESPESNALTKASALARASLSGELLRAVDTLVATKPSKRIESQAKRASVMQTLAGAAKTVYGWSEGQQQPSVRIAIMGNTTIASEPVIDVPTLPPSE